VKSKVVLDTTIGEVDHLTISQALSKDGLGKTYTTAITGPTGEPLMPPIVHENPLDVTSMTFVIARTLARLEELTYAYNSVPYFWDGRKWAPADGWLHALSNSFHGLLRTGEFSGKGSKCFYSSMRANWLSTQRPALKLSPYGTTGGVPMKNGVLNLYPREYVQRMTRQEREAIGPCAGFTEDGTPDESPGAYGLLPKDPGFDLITGVPHVPSDGNVHIVPADVTEVILSMGELAAGGRKDSLLARFLDSALDADQQSIIQQWFGYHLVLHRIPKQEKMVYLYGTGGNGKGVLIGLLRGLVTDDAVATLSLKDLKISANLEALAGKAAMIGAEGTPETDNELLKTIVSWEKLQVNPKYRDPFDLLPMCLVTQASNPPPEFKDDSDAMVRRVIAVQMRFKAKDDNRVTDLARRVLKDEYPLLVAWALNGAQEVLRAGGLVIPKSVAEHSEQVVRPVRSVDRFMPLLEFGNFEVADDELYAAYTLSSKKQGITRIEPRREFFESLLLRLERSGNSYTRRMKAKGYPPQSHINESQQLVALCPQLLGVSSCELFLGFRVREGPFGPAIGQKIPTSGEFKRRDVPDFGDGT
jgi:P4 family phage/plasmid primase-like protien